MFQKLNNDQLKKRSKLFLGIAIGMLLVMCFTLGMALYEISHDHEDSLAIYIVPTILAPMTFIPIMISTMMATALKKRNKP